MENTQPASSPVPSSRQAAPARVRVSSPADVLAVVPHLFGFHPSGSVVVLGIRGRNHRVELGFRYDLPDPPDPEAAAAIAGHAAAILARQRADAVIGVGYGPGRVATPVLDALAAAARRDGLDLAELLRVEDGRYWSFLCPDVSCCPAEGVAFDPAGHPAAEVMAAAGLAVHPDRAALARTLAPPSGAAERAMDRAAGRACTKTAKLLAEGKAAGGGDPARLVNQAGRRAVQEAIRIYRDGGEITDATQLGWLLVTLASLPVRDDAWSRMEPGHAEAHQRLWADLVRSAGPLWTPAPASLLAFTAWQRGDGALASIAIERALAADPGYPMALLLRDALDAGIPPSAARMPMTPDEVQQSYEQDQGDPRRAKPGPRQPGRARATRRKRPRRAR